MVSCLSEHKGISSSVRMHLASLSTTSGFKRGFAATALAIDLRFPRPTNRPNFLSECDKWWYLFLV